MPESDTLQLSSELSHYGINGSSESVRWFDNERPELIEYLDLIRPQGPSAEELLQPDGVVENQEKPLLYFLNHSQLANTDEKTEDQLKHLRRSIACRGDRAFLAIVRPGVLEVIPANLENKTPKWVKFEAGTNEAQSFFPRLALGRSEEFPTGRRVDFLFKEMYKLVESSATRLEQLKIKRTDVLSLVGRALFFRFLLDRGIIRERDDVSKIVPKAKSLVECFDTAENAASTCRWLDKTFNGDFLPLSDHGNLEFFQSVGKRTGKRIFFHLGAVVRREEPSGDDGYQARLKIDWGDLDFAHIPVGLLSQVYEKLSWKWDRDVSKKTSVHYTPRNIASTLVGEAFDGLPDAHSARVLDPACGASIFLVIAFRRIYLELWKRSKRRPDTKAIRSILENQLVGFDISDSALKLSALSLYLTAIELDPDPVPPEKLKFKALRSGKHAILFDWRRDEDKPDGPVVGSIGNHVSDRFNHSFDLILCNPPWTNIGAQNSDVSAELDQVSTEIVKGLDPEIGATYKNPDSVPDLPFVWKSTQWCKPNGRLAMALPARTLFKQGPMAQRTREALFRLIEVNGIVNGSNLRKTPVWPDMNQPFMLMFATNRKPKANHALHFISPHTDLNLNSLGEVRIDSKSANLVSLDEVTGEPWIWKALAVGNSLDVDAVRKIIETNLPAFHEYWRNDLQLVDGNGYQVKPNQKPQKDATQLHELRNLDSSNKFRFAVVSSELELFSHPTAFRTRLRKRKEDPLEIYRGPLALVKESPGSDRTMGRALFCESDLAYNESFFGYSGKGSATGTILARFLQLFIHSQIWLHYALITSGKLGFERPNVDKSDLDNCPFYPYEKLDNAQRKQVEGLSKRLIGEDPTVFPDIDQFFGELYGLSRHEIEVITDTVEVRDPTDELGKRGSQIPTHVECNLYRRKLLSFLKPLFKALGQKPDIEFLTLSDKINSPFSALLLTSNGKQPTKLNELFKNQILPLAYETGATRIIQELDGVLLIGILRQYRYWTKTQARLLGAEIMRNHMTVFEG